MKRTRASGILLHPTSLPSPFGIGDFGAEAYRFVGLMRAAGQSVWQMLPLGPTGFGNSPYQSPSSAAGNPLLVSPQLLQEEELLEAEDLADRPQVPDNRVDYDAVREWKDRIMERAHDRFFERAGPEQRESFDRFCHENAYWLEDYALFSALRGVHRGAPWTQWAPELRDREPGALDRARNELARGVGVARFTQYQFFRQWDRLREFCRGAGLTILGDIPIYVAHNSVDVWANQHLFELDERGEPTVVGGVPPDYFSATGQLWGNPLYKWREHEATGFAWWVERLRSVLKTCDLVRLDHFRALHGYWEIPADAETAVSGRWVDGPRDAFMQALRNAFGEKLPIVAENLGIITDEIEDFRRRYNIPGMAVLQFGLGYDAESSAIPPYAFEPNSIAYTGTHDNDTLRGWWRELSEEPSRREFIRKYVGATSVEDFSWACIHTLIASVADTVVFPLQDVADLDSDARMNRPGLGEGNWTWRAGPDDFTAPMADRLRDMCKTYGRLPAGW